MPRLRCSHAHIVDSQYVLTRSIAGTVAPNFVKKLYRACAIIGNAHKQRNVGMYTVFEGSIVIEATQPEDEFALHIVSSSSAQTQKLGVHLGELVRGGELILLNGQLGMGKTTFTQGLAQGMGISDTITSPTFTLLKEYTSPLRSIVSPVQNIHGKARTQKLALYHFDLYRLDEPEEIIALGFEDYFYDSEGVCVVEWADKADGLWVPERLTISMSPHGETGRGILFTATGTRYSELLRQFQKNS